MRKIIIAVLGAVVALFGLFGVQIHLVGSIDPLNIIGSLLIVGVWLFTEFRQDWLDFKAGLAQTNQWGDPAFWTTAIASVVLPLLTAFGVAVPEVVISIAATLLSILVPLFIKPKSPISARKLISISR